MRISQFAAMVLIAGASLFYGERAAAQTYNAFSQFSVGSNPNGVWRYVSAGGLLTAETKTCNGIAKDYCWTIGSSFPNVAADEANKTNTTIHYADVTLSPKYLDFDPEGTANVAFQWTAPATATVRVAGNFLGVASDEGSHMVAVLHNGTALGSFTISHYAQKRPSNTPSASPRGDTITFISYTGNGGDALSTGL